MRHILAEVLTLEQYLQTSQRTPMSYPNNQCPSCSRYGLWRHGSYGRKSDRSGKLNPIRIQRFLCRGCWRTCSVLPECIPARRWYLWEIQQVALVLILSGKSFYAAAKEILPSRQTIKRWIMRFQEKFLEHRDALCQRFADFGRTEGFTDFWRRCLESIPLCKAMRLCHVAGVLVP